MTTETEPIESIFEKFKQLNDWNRYPMPEVFYEHFKVKKPQPQTVQEALSYSPFMHQLSFAIGKTEVRGPVEGGVREIKEYLTLPVEVKMVEDAAPDQLKTTFEEDVEYELLYKESRAWLAQEDADILASSSFKEQEKDYQERVQARHDCYINKQEDTQETVEIVKRIMVFLGQGLKPASAVQ